MATFELTDVEGGGVSGAPVVSVETGMIDYPKVTGESYCYDPNTKKLLPESIAIGDGSVGSQGLAQGYDYIGQSPQNSTSFMTSDGFCWVVYISNTSNTSSVIQYLGLYGRDAVKGGKLRIRQTPMQITANDVGSTSAWALTRIVETTKDVFVGACCSSSQYSTSASLRPFKLVYDTNTKEFTLEINNSTNIDGANTASRPVAPTPVIWDGEKVVFFCAGTNNASDCYANNINIDTLANTKTVISGFKINDITNDSNCGDIETCNMGVWRLSDGRYAMQGYNSSASNIGGIYSESNGTFTRDTVPSATWASSFRYLKLEEDVFAYLQGSGTSLIWRVKRYNPITLDFDDVIDQTYVLGQEAQFNFYLANQSWAARIGNSVLFFSTSGTRGAAVIKFDPVTFEVDIDQTTVNIQIGDAGTQQEVLDEVSWDYRGIAIQRDSVNRPAIGVFSVGALISGDSPIRLGYLSGSTGDVLDITVIAPSVNADVVVGNEYSNSNFIALSDELLVPRDKRPAIFERSGFASIDQKSAVTRFQSTLFDAFGSLAIEPNAATFETSSISFDSSYGKSFSSEAIVFNDSSTNQACTVGFAVDGMLRTLQFSGINTATTWPQALTFNAVTVTISGRADVNASGENIITYALKEG